MRSGARLALVGLVAMLGCGPQSSFERVPLEGTATLDGQPFSGSISLRPQPGTTGPVASAPVVDGTFAFDERTGPVSGPHVAFLMPKKTSRHQESVYTGVDVPRREPYRIEVVITSAEAGSAQAASAPAAIPSAEGGAKTNKGTPVIDPDDTAK